MLKLLNPSPAPIPFYTARAVPHMGRAQKMGTDTQMAFFSPPLTDWELDLHLQIAHGAFDLWIYIQLSGFSYKPVPSPHGQSFFLLFLLALLKNMLLRFCLHPTTQCFTVIQLLVCWDHCCTDSTVSAVCCSLIHICIFLFFLSYPQCVSCLQQEPSMCQPPPSSMAP